MRLIHVALLVAGMGIGSMMLSGCGSSTETAAPSAPEADHDHASHEDHDGESITAAGHNHGGWWCTEHGVPEEECALCDTSLVAQFKEKGDWCDQHHRPESQCFQCDPTRFERFAARYEAKFGQQPPKPTE